jgi:hypothetical protein
MAELLAELKSDTARVFDMVKSYLIAFGVGIVCSLFLTALTFQIMRAISVVKDLSEFVKLAVTTRLYAAIAQSFAKYL